MPVAGHFQCAERQLDFHRVTMCLHSTSPAVVVALIAFQHGKREVWQSGRCNWTIRLSTIVTEPGTRSGASHISRASQGFSRGNLLRLTVIDGGQVGSVAAKP